MGETLRSLIRLVSPTRTAPNTIEIEVDLVAESGRPRPRLRAVSGARAGEAVPLPQPQQPPEPPEVKLKVGPGDRLVVERKEHRLYDFYGGVYYMMSKELAYRLPMLGLTATQYDILLRMMGSQEKGGVVRKTHKELGAELGIHRQEVGKAMEPLITWGLIWQVRRGEYQINPRCAYWGQSGSQREDVARIPDHVPELNLPDYRVRPPRRRRPLKGSAES